MQTIEKFSSCKTEKIDILFLAASSSMRAYECVKFFEHMNYPIEKVVILCFDRSMPDKSDKDYEEYMKYSLININKTIIDCQGEEIDLTGISLDSSKRIAVDITGLSIPDLFRLFFILKEVNDINEIQTFYTEPKYYNFKQGMFDVYEYLQEERKYRAIDEYFTSGTDGKEILAIFLGFDRLTSTIVKEEVNPYETIILNGFPSVSPKLKEISLLNNYELILSLGDPDIYNVKAHNPFSAYNALEDIRKKHTNELINICVLGSKPMALGACLYALDNKENIKVSYAYPKKYGKRITEGYAKTWHYEIAFQKK